MNVNDKSLLFQGSDDPSSFLVPVVIWKKHLPLIVRTVKTDKFLDVERSSLPPPLHGVVSRHVLPKRTLPLWRL